MLKVLPLLVAFSTLCAAEYRGRFISRASLMSDNQAISIVRVNQEGSYPVFLHDFDTGESKQLGVIKSQWAPCSIRMKAPEEVCIASVQDIYSFNTNSGAQSHSSFDDDIVGVINHGQKILSEHWPSGFVLSALSYAAPIVPDWMAKAIVPMPEYRITEVSSRKTLATQAIPIDLFLPKSLLSLENNSTDLNDGRFAIVEHVNLDGFQVRILNQDSLEEVWKGHFQGTSRGVQSLPDGSLYVFSFECTCPQCSVTWKVWKVTPGNPVPELIRSQEELDERTALPVANATSLILAPGNNVRMCSLTSEEESAVDIGFSALLTISPSGNSVLAYGKGLNMVLLDVSKKQIEQKRKISLKDVLHQAN